MINKFINEISEFKDVMKSDLIVKRLANSKKVADIVAFLCSTSASYINDYTLILNEESSLQLTNRSFSD